MTDLNATIARCFEHVERIERDPRDNPIVGDRVKNRETLQWREVTQVHPNGVTWIGNLRECGQMNTCSFRTWRKWAATAEVIKRGDA